MDSLPPIRKIIHVDMDAFYASVEMRDHPELLGRAIAIGHAGGRGVVMTCNYEARKFGVRSAMPSKTAARLCPHLLFVQPRMDAYKAVSRQIQSIFYEFTDLVEPLSLDEAYLDVTQNKPGYHSAIFMARLIKEEIKARTGLTGTAGVSYNKFLAKMASDYRKPDGLNYISMEMAEAFLEQLPVAKFHGIGAKTAEKMAQLGLHTGSDLKQWERQDLINRFGKAGHFYYDIVRGIDLREVQPHRPMKSVSIEDTFPEDQLDLIVLRQSLSDLNERLFRRLEKKSTFGKTVTLKVKYGDFTQITRSKTAEHFLQSPLESLPLIWELIEKTEAGNRPVRLLGIGISNFQDEGDILAVGDQAPTLF